MTNMLTVADLSSKLVQPESRPGAKQIAPPLKQIDAAGAAVPKEVTQMLAVPCDLRAVTQAVVDYPQMLAEKREKTR
jgi:hypothetical protein